MIYFSRTIDLFTLRRESKNARILLCETILLPVETFSIIQSNASINFLFDTQYDNIKYKIIYSK